MNIEILNVDNSYRDSPGDKVCIKLIKVKVIQHSFDDGVLGRFTFQLVNNFFTSFCCSWEKKQIDVVILSYNAGEPGTNRKVSELHNLGYPSISEF
jgi:hypothetical protein